MWTRPDVGRARGHCVGKLSRGSKRNLAGILSKVPQNINEGFHPMLRSHCCPFSYPRASQTLLGPEEEALSLAAEFQSGR